MVDVPERIWAASVTENYGEWQTVTDGLPRPTEYTRSDLVAELAAENERLRQDRVEWKRWAEQHHSDLRRTEALASTGAVKVKPLEWVELNEGKAFRALLPVIGSIRIEPYGVCGWWEVLWSMPGQCDKLIPDVFDTPDEAKAAAQADYERRILSALEATPPAPKVTEALTIAHEALEAASDQILESYRTWVADDKDAKPRYGQYPRYDQVNAAIRVVSEALTTAQEARKP